MTNDLDPQRLHDRATRGEALTAEEHGALEQWYAQQDRAEAALLASSPPASDTDLQQQIQITLDQLHVVTERIQILSRENEAVRHDNAELRKRLAQRAASSAA